MTMTLREALRGEPFVQARAHVLAGLDRLDREIRWVHCSEMPQAARLFHGGELYLTQGRGLSRDEDEQRRWVGALADADIAGVGIETGVVVDAVPPAVVAAARERGLPVIALRTPAYFMAMTQLVHSAIVDSQVETLRRVEEIGRRFARLALQGAGMQAILDQLGSVVAAPAVLADNLHQVAGYTPTSDTTVAMLAQWPAHARQGHRYADHDGGPETVTSGGLTCTCQSIVFRGELWGSVHVLHGSHRLDEVGQLSLDRAAAAIGLAFAAADGEQRHDDDARSALIQELLNGYADDTDRVRQRLRGLGMPTAGPMRVLRVQPIERTDPPRMPHRSSRALRTALRAVAARLTRDLGGGGHPVLAGYAGTCLLVLVGGRIAEDTLAEAAQCAARAGADNSGELDLLVGVSGQVTLDSLPRAAGEAEDAVRYGLATGSRTRVLPARGLGIGRLLLRLDESSVLSEHIEVELGRVLDHDSSAPPLLPTLVAYLELSGNKSEVARRLHIERRSLYHRLDRIRALLGADLDDPATRLRLMIAVAGLRYRERSSRIRAAGQTGKHG